MGIGRLVFMPRDPHAKRTPSETKMMAVGLALAARGGPGLKPGVTKGGTAHEPQ